MTGLAGARNGPETPQAFARPWVISVKKSSDTILPASDTNDDFVLERERCHRHRMPHGVIGNLNVPAHPAGSSIKGNQVRIDCPEKNLIIQKRHSTVYLPTTGHDPLRERTPVSPDGASCAEVKCGRITRWLRNVHDAVDNER